MTADSRVSASQLRTAGWALALAALVVALPAPRAGAQTRGCAVDAATGMPVVGSMPGICVIHTGARTVFVQATEDGLLVVATDTGADDVGPSNPDGTAPLNIYDRAAEVIFCPPDLLDPGSGAPTQDCLWSLDSMSAGAAALVGSGRLFASAVFDATGSARCPSSFAVMASTTSPGGDDLELSSSFSLLPVASNTTGDQTRAPRCEASRPEVRLSYRNGADGRSSRAASGEAGGSFAGNDPAAEPLAAELAWLRDLSDDDWRVVTELVRLDAQDWNLLRRLLTLDASQVAELETRLRTDGAAVLTDDGGVGPAIGAGSDPSGTVVTTESVEGILDDILNRVNSIFSTVGSISGRIPNRSDIRALLMEGSFITRIANVIQRVQEVIGGVLDVAATLRDGFDAWNGSSCDPASQCAAFKADLSTLFDDIGDTAVFIQSMSCIDRPGLTVRRPEFTLLRSLVIDSAPPVVLYTLAKVLERVDPSDGGGGWKTIFREVLDEVSPELRDEMLELCGHQLEFGEIGGSSGIKCRILRPEEVGLQLNAARVVANRKELVAEFIDSFLKDDVVAQADAVAGGGGGAGTNVKNPPKVVSKQAKDIAEDLPDKISEIIDQRDQCVEADADIESDLRDCQPPISVLLQTTLDELPPHPTFRDVKVVVQTRMSQVQECQLAGLCTGLRFAEAQSFFDRANSNAGTIAGYKDLCCAYQALNGGTQIPCPRP